MQTTDNPIACTLSAGDVQERLRWIRRITTDSLTDHRVADGTLLLTYRHEAWPELREIVAKEQQCCAFLKFSLRELADGVELEIQAPEGADTSARWLFDQFLPADRQVSPRNACGCAPGACR